MSTLKTFVILVAAWTCSPPDLLADVRTFLITGSVSNAFNGGPFLAGRPYAVTLAIDTSSPKRTVVPERGDYLSAVTSFVFDYDSGAYLAQAQNKGGVIVHNAELHDKLDVVDVSGFPPVGGQPHSGTYFWLMDTSAVVFASTDLPKTLNVESFRSRFFQISWGLDLNARTLFLTVESIRLVELRPEITSWGRTTNGLLLEIALPAMSYTNVLERSLQIGPAEQWDAVMTFVTTGGKTNWLVPLQTGESNVFYRMRP